MKIKVETEKKYYCLEPEKLITIAENLNFKQIKKITETDEYFTDIDSEFIKNRTCLRLRKYNNETLEITYKGKSNSLLGQYCKLENNIAVSIDEYPNFIKLLSSLGYYSYVEVIKERSIYELKKGKYQYSIMIDKLDGIGGFVEFEIISETKDANRKQLKEELDKFVSNFNVLNLKEALKPYRDIVADHIYKNTLDKKENNKIYINIDTDILNYEKDFFKKYKDQISKICNQNIKWGIYKKNTEIDNKIVSLVDEYLDNLIFDNKELLVMLELLKKLEYQVSFITKINELFITHLFGKLNIDINNIIYLKEDNLNQTIKKNNLNNSLIICNKNLKEINSLLLILINNK